MAQFSKEDVRTFLMNNIESVLDTPIITSMLAEKMAAEQRKAKYVNTTGYDYYCENLKRVEVKSTWTIQLGKYFRIQSYQQKYGLMHHIHIIDGVHNREFIIPAEDWFDHVGEEKEFWWVASYDQNSVRSSSMSSNTKFLLKYEI